MEAMIGARVDGNKICLRGDGGNEQSDLNGGEGGGDSRGSVDSHYQALEIGVAQHCWADKSRDREGKTGECIRIDNDCLVILT
ncbi:hypothetical protein U1Q18_025528, partial [Sarracenia purpurea var. burkii]